ncbi:MAG: DUF4156 domain-containing protein [Pseudomonadales bacterium]|jgi:hypothetical protein|nr:DUF4156 domain-containing protein [Pseudomonadales bacterium]
MRIILSSRILLASLLLLALAACTPFVKITPAGDNVAVMDASQVVNCTSAGAISVAVVNKVVVNRDPNTVAQELRTLARNRAANRGDTIVPTSNVSNGEQTFAIYQCRR